MRRRKLSDALQNFVDQVRGVEERLFADQLDHASPSRMKSDGYSWYYRPSHHAASGLLTPEDVELLKQPSRRLLSIGACPAYFEQALVALGIPTENIVVTDIDSALMQSGGEMEKIMCDATKTWPDIGTFDRIIFPESLCIMISDTLRHQSVVRTDVLESTLLAGIMKQALKTLRTDGQIRANGPMSHPNVIKLMSEQLREQQCDHHVDYQRFLLVVTRVMQ